MSAIKVLKFGGTSVGSADAIKKVVEIIMAPSGSVKIVAVIVSAMSEVTDQLIKTATLASQKNSLYKKEFLGLEKLHLETVKKLTSGKLQKQTVSDLKNILNELKDVLHGVFIINELSPRVLDYIMSFGERLSAKILTAALRDKNIMAEMLDGRKIIVTNDDFGRALVNFRKTDENIVRYFKKHQTLQIVTGFIAATEKGLTTTLGRGGSDYSVAIIGAALNAKSIEIWTDVSGVMTADPRKTKSATAIEKMTYEEAVEISYFGAKVIHPPTMLPAREKNIPIQIKNTFNPTARGTTIGNESSARNLPAKGISSISDISMLRVEGSGMIGIPGISTRIFGALAKEKVNVILITQASSEHSICIAVAPKDAPRAKKAIEEEFVLERNARLVNDTVVENHLSIIALVGEGMRKRRGVANQLFSSLTDSNINVVAIAQGSSELNISVVINTADETRAITAVHDKFFGGDKPIINVFLVGTGLIGSALLRQMEKQKNLKVVGVADSKTMTFDGGDTKTKMNLEKYVGIMKGMSLPNSVFVDCTASDSVAMVYDKLLTAGVSIVTPNKKAASGDLRYYRKLKRLALSHKTKFIYKTNVGAGLPVISTLHDLLKSGDTILKVEAVLSGTLSYVFNNLTGDKKFSEVVKQAKELGYTEPDPKDDLRGTDVARKILILGREIGLPLELKDIKTENLIKKDNFYEEKVNAAEKNGEVLRYIATIENGKAEVSLKAVPSTHSFYNLTENDNIVAFTTKRYSQTPLVIRGPGAGAEVTAAGVFRDILQAADQNQ